MNIPRWVVWLVSGAVVIVVVVLVAVGIAGWTRPIPEKVVEQTVVVTKEKLVEVTRVAKEAVEVEKEVTRVVEVTPVPPTATPMPTPDATAQFEGAVAQAVATEVARLGFGSVSVAATAPVTTTGVMTVGVGLPMIGSLFRTPVKAVKVINPESAWLIAEPGRILDASAAWVIPSVEMTHSANIPEGGFAYFSMGEGNIQLGDVLLAMEPMSGTNYLVVIRGRIDDGLVDTDLNMTAKVTGFRAGHAIWSKLQPGAYVSSNWFLQQLQASSQVKDAAQSSTNCGALGCSTTYVVLFDASTHYYQKFRIEATDLSKWTLVKTNAE